MRKTTKNISFLLAFVLLIISVCAVPVFAADVTYSVTPAVGATGETVSVSVSVSTSYDIQDANVSLKYNPSELQVISCVAGGAASGGYVSNTGSSVDFSGALSAKSGTVFNVSFKILKESGKAGLTLSSSGNTGADGVSYGASVSNSSITVLNKVPAEKVTLDKTSVTLKKGDTVKVRATISPSNSTDSAVFYSSDDDIVTVSNDGVITAVKGGTATITALVGEQSAKCKVTVTVPQTGIKANGNTTQTVSVGDKINLSVVRVPADSTDSYTASWTTSNPSVATVANGVVTAVAPGEATITAKVNVWTVTYKITVTDKTGESTTVEESTTEESTTIEESTTEESTSNIFVTEPTTPPYIETTTGEDFSLVEPTINESINENNEKNNEGYLYLLIIATAGVVAVVIGAVTFFVTKGYYGTKKKQKIIVEEKFKR